MLVFVAGARDVGEAAGCTQSGERVGVDGKVAEGRGVGGVGGEGAAAKVVGVGRAEYEDAFGVCEVEGLVGPGGTRA